jgi:hypothetical protein
MALDLSKLSDEELMALSKGDVSTLSDSALYSLVGQEAPQVEPVEQSAGPLDGILDRGIAQLEGLAHVGTGFTTGMLGGTVEGAQGILDTMRDGSFGTQEGVKKAGEKFMKGMSDYTYEPRTERGKEVAKNHGKVMEQVMPLMGIFPQVAALHESARPVAVQAKQVGTDVFAKMRENVESRNKVSSIEEAMKERQEPSIQAPQGVRRELPYFPENREPILVGEDGVAVRMRDAENIDTFKQAATEQQRQAKMEQPLEFEKVEPKIDPEFIEGQSRRIDDSIPFTEEVFSEKLEARMAEFKQREIDLAYRMQAFEEKITTLSKESAFREMERLQQEQTRLDLERKKLFEDQAKGRVPEPTQRSVEIESPKDRTTYRPNSNQPLGQTSFGKGQRGSVGWNKKPQTYEQYAADVRKKYPNIDEATIKRGWEIEQSKKQVKDQAKAVGNIPGLEKTAKDLQVYDGADSAKVLETLKSSEDLAGEPGVYIKHFSPRGQIAKEILDNPAVSAGISRIKHVTDLFNRKSETELFGKNGIITKITQFENPFGPGKIGNLFEQRFKAKNRPEYQQKLNEIEAALDKEIDTLMSKNFEEVNAIRAAQGKEPIKNVHKYFPSMFDGKFVFEVKREGKKPVLMTLHDKKQAEAMRRILGDKGFETTEVRTRKAVQNRFGDAEHLAAEYQMMLDFLDTSDPAIESIRAALEGRSQASATTTQGYHNRMKEYTGFEGNLGNNPFKTTAQNFYDSKKALIRYQEAHNAWLSANELAKFQKEIGDIKGGPRNSLDYLDGYINDIIIGKDKDGFLKPAMDVVEKITGLSDQSQRRIVRQYANLETVRLIGAGSLRALTQNVFQPLEATLPKILEMYPHMKNADILSPMLLGFRDYVQVLAKHNHGEVTGLLDSVFNTKWSEHEGKLFGANARELYKYATESGLIDPTVLESTPLFKRKVPQAAWKFTSSLLARSSEQAARFSTFSTLSRWLMDAGVPKDKAMLQAKQWTEGHMVDYSQEARPGVLANTGMIGDMGGRLQRFKMNQLGRYVDYMNVARKTGNAAPVAAMLGMNLLLAGAQGLIGMDLINTVIDGYTSMSNDPKMKDFSLRTYMAENTPEWFNWGIASSTTGLGLFNAFSQQTVGDGSLRNFFPVYSNLAEQGRTVARQLTTDWTEEPEFEKGRQISSVVPSSLQHLLADKYLTEEVNSPKTGEVKKKAISKYTGEPTYTYTGKERRFGNIMPYEKAKEQALRAEKRKEETRFDEGKNEQYKSLERQAMDIYMYKNGNPMKKMKFKTDLQKYVQGYYGDPDSQDKVFESIAEKVGVSKQELKKLIDNPANFSRLPQLKRELQYLNLMEKK